MEEGDLFRLSGGLERDPRVEAWFMGVTDPMRLMTREWFERMRQGGADVRELLHEGYPVACVGGAAFGYVNAFKAHASVGFFAGAMLPDPAGLLEGEGKRMRHVKLRPGKEFDEAALGELIAAAYHDMRRRLGHRSSALKRATPMKTSTPPPAKAKAAASPAELIEARIRELGDWRGKTLARIRALIKLADPDVVEEWKWMGTPVWEHAGIICTGETYKDYVKTTFAKGAALADPKGLFNASLDGNTRRAIDFHKGEKIDEKAFTALIRAAVALNTSKRASARPVRSQKKPKRA